MVSNDFPRLYYRSFCDRIEAKFKLSVPIDPFEDGDVYNCEDIDNNDVVKDE